jgi:hypothetical protein
MPEWSMVIAFWRMFNQAIRGHRAMPKYLSSDHDPLYRFEQYKPNSRTLDVAEIKTVPYVPLPHPFVARLIGTVRREYWIARYSGRLSISKTICWSSGITSTVIARITHWRGKHPTGGNHDWSRI